MQSIYYFHLHSLAIFSFLLLQRQIKKTLQGKTVVELFVQFLVHLLLSTIGGGKRTICQGGKEADIKDCVHTPSSEDPHHHKTFPQDTSYIYVVALMGRITQTVMTFLLPSVITQLMEQLNCLTFGYFFVGFVGGGDPSGAVELSEKFKFCNTKNGQIASFLTPEHCSARYRGSQFPRPSLAV